MSCTLSAKTADLLLLISNAFFFSKIKLRLWTLHHRNREKSPYDFLFFLKSGLFVEYDVLPSTNTGLLKTCLKKVSVYVQKEIVVNLEDPGIDPGTSRMLSGRSTI